MGSSKLVQKVRDEYGIGDGDTTPDGQLSVQVANFCLGVCDRSPVVKLDDEYYGHVNADDLTDLVNRAIEGHEAMHASEVNHG